MEKEEFFQKGFVYLVILYTFSYCLITWNETFRFAIVRSGVIGFWLFASEWYLLSYVPFWYGKWIAGVWIALSMFCGIVNIFCFYHFGSTLNSAMLLNIFETNLSEILSFFELYLSFKVIALVFLFFVISLGFFFIPFPKDSKIKIGFYCLYLFGALSCLYQAYATSSRYYSLSSEELDYIIPLGMGLKTYHTYQESKEVLKSISKISQ